MLENPYRLIRGGGLWGSDLLVFDSLPSSNAWTLANLPRLRHGTVVRAVRQSRGKGRFDRVWVSPGRCCLAVSAVIDPSTHGDFPAPLLLSVAALAVRETLGEFGINGLLKWPNDVMTPRGKVCGILAEKDATSPRIVLGIGLNVNVTAPALAAMRFEQAAVSMAVERERLFDIELVGRRFLINLEKNIDFAWFNGPAFITRRWGKADYLAGKEISIQGPSGRIVGAYGGIQDDGQLCLLDAAGQRHSFWSGDVSLKESAATR